MAKMTQDNRLLSISTPLGKDYLLINKIYAEERISELFQFNVELWYDQQNDDAFVINIIDGKDIVGQPVSVKMKQDDGGERSFSGMINNFIVLGRFKDYSIYTATIVPHVWKLTRHSQNRIFQHKTVPDILRKVFDGFKVEVQTQTPYKPRNICVQYRESDFDFASRLMEEEGIYYYFEHTENGEKMIIRDDFKSPDNCPGKFEIPIFDEDLTGEVFESAIKIWQINYALQTGKVTLWDYHFQAPTKHLDVEKTSIHNVGGNRQLENYTFTPGYARNYDNIDKSGGERSDLPNVFDDNKRMVANRMLMLDSQYQTVNGRADCCTLTPGYRFKLKNHPNGEFNGFYILLSVKHQAEQSPAYLIGFEAPMAYENEFICISHGSGSAEFRPPLKTPKPVMHGSQTAVVVGPAGEEIFTDKYGRVKVQFNWDRENKYDPDSSCWVRVAHDLAGKKWGEMHIPRIGQEVIVDFLEGNPDQPIIVGSVYNEVSMPHYELPKYKTLTYLKTRTTPDDGKGFNELRFEDKQGKEQVFIHSQKRMDVRVRQSLYETCGGDRQELIGLRTDNKPGGNLAVTVGGNHDFHVKYDEFIGIDGKRYEKVVKDLVEGYKGNKTTIITGKSEQNAREIIFEAAMKISFKVGGNCIVIDPTGITIAGTPTVKINSGGWGTETSSPMLGNPLDAEPADTGEPGYLDKPRTGGGGGGRRWEQLNSQHYVAPPRPGEDPRMTAIRNTLQNSAQGRHALEVYDRYGVTSSFNSGVGGGYSGNNMNLDPTWGDFNNSAFVHEMNHAEADNEHTSADIVNQSRADYVDQMMREEAHGNATGIQAADELAAAGQPQSSTYDRTSYDAGYAAGRAAEQARNPNATPEELDAAGRREGENRIYDDYRSGRITPSDIGGVQQPPYPDYYGNAWDRAHPSPSTP